MTTVTLLLLNYNVFDVEIKIDNTINPYLADGEVVTYVLGDHEFVKIAKPQ